MVYVKEFASASKYIKANLCLNYILYWSEGNNALNYIKNIRVNPMLNILIQYLCQHFIRIYFNPSSF